jgi:hypothetical protein
MEKFLWNAGGAVLLALNVWCLMIAFVSNNRVWGFALIALAIADWFYKEKRPTWIEV